MISGYRSFEVRPKQSGYTISGTMRGTVRVANHLVTQLVRKGFCMLDTWILHDIKNHQIKRRCCLEMIKIAYDQTPHHPTLTHPSPLKPFTANCIPRNISQVIISIINGPSLRVLRPRVWDHRNPAKQTCPATESRMNGLPSRFVTNQFLEHESDVPFSRALPVIGEQKPRFPYNIIIDIHRYSLYSSTLVVTVTSYIYIYILAYEASLLWINPVFCPTAVRCATPRPVVTNILPAVISK